VARVDPSPNVVIVGVPGEIEYAGRVEYNSRFTAALGAEGLIVDEFQTDGKDYYIYDQIVAVLGGPPAVSIIERILATQLPRRVL